LTRGSTRHVDLLINVLRRVPAVLRGRRRCSSARRSRRRGLRRASHVVRRGRRRDLFSPPPSIAAVRFVLRSTGGADRRRARHGQVILVAGRAGGAEAIGDLRGQLPPSLLFVAVHALFGVASSSHGDAAGIASTVLASRAQFTSSPDLATDAPRPLSPAAAAICNERERRIGLLVCRL